MKNSERGLMHYVIVVRNLLSLIPSYQEISTTANMRLAQVGL